MSDKSRDDVTKSIERVSLAHSYSSEKVFDVVDKSAKGLSNLKTNMENERKEKERQEKEKQEKEQREKEEQERQQQEENQDNQYVSRLKTNESQDANISSTNIQQEQSRLKTNINNDNQKDSEEYDEEQEETSTKFSKLKTVATKGFNKVYGLNENQGKISKTVSVISKTGKVTSKVSRTLTRASKDLDKAMSSDGTDKDYLKTQVKRKSNKIVKKQVQTKVINPIKKPIKKFTNKITAPIKKKLAAAFKIVLKKAIKLLITAISSISEFILPLALIILIIVAFTSIFSWGSETTNNYQNYILSIQESYDKEVDKFLRENPTGVVVGVRGGYGEINWRVPFAIMQGVGADISFDDAEKELINEFKKAGLLEKHEIINQDVDSGYGELTMTNSRKVMVITNPTLEDYLEWCKNNYIYIKNFMTKKNILGYVDNTFDSIQLETIKSLYTSESVFDEFDKEYADTPPKYGSNETKRNLNSEYYNSKNTLAVAGFKGQCTWYSFGRALESTNKKVPTGNAQTWLSSAVAMGYDTGSYPNPNSIVVMAGRKFGHVAYVESYDGEKITISEGNVGNKCSSAGANCSQVEYANNHANELVRTKTYSSLKAYKEANKASGLYVVGFIYLNEERS